MSRNDLKMTLEAARVNAGYTQVQAAKILGLKPTTLASWEKDSTRLSYVEAHRLARLYRITPDLLFFGSKYEFIRKMKGEEQ
ncbi:helix-turn-helix transcriptional regulator [Lactobacillus crispatus]|uniref:helix-turn-helix transcriptional regulator n=1 Tax=Lactobacillus crispatus TaxID=47770 RepID=UPI0022ABD09A|nr:helix-turn-helix transcriptional regulator [Lactobacillus crispatus]MCZ3847155.1 helix-turn-helix domain-containing protein [Lactobacillus crispatus]MCZ3849417.1 helix-turn-helix domain-containing protein [Lactobacillus crispatus]MCZ3855353.1 helix-turn-helix domain-containing protein [Lactobacillus crispatus]MCZ3857536.1 helix-turn-helix domain-containing protein [Lactobacillus crispatus]MCZ3859902.1 helix-turn-helix domain-containing protein [Lactobacillus crispatus]